MRKNLVTQVFKVLDSVNPDGVLTVEDIEKAYSTSAHPDVIAGKMTRKQALQEIIDGMEVRARAAGMSARATAPPSHRFLFFRRRGRWATATGG